MAALPPTSLCIAYGSRGVDKLVETLSSPDAETQRFTLTTLNTLLSSQESKVKALSEQLQLVPTIVTLLGSEDNEVKRQAALVLASLALLYQGRLAIGEAGAVRELSGLLVDSGETGVREACSSALLALSESRDGCATLVAQERIVETLVSALDDDHLAAKQCSLRALANLSRLDLGISEALDGGIMTRLAVVLDPAAAHPGAEGSALVCSGLQTLWNLANTPDGKVAALDACLLPFLAHHCSFYSPREQRLSAGAIMAITINKQGKMESSECLAPLADLLLSLDTDEDTLRDVIGALKNMSEFPAARKAIESYMRKHGMPSEQLNMYDSKPWPQSIRYLHQNFAPGGQTATHEAAVRKRWGYPDPISA